MFLPWKRFVGESEEAPQGCCPEGTGALQKECGILRLCLLLDCICSKNNFAWIGLLKMLG